MFTKPRLYAKLFICVMWMVVCAHLGVVCHCPEYMFDL